MSAIPVVFRIEVNQQSEAGLTVSFDHGADGETGSALKRRPYTYGIFFIFAAAYFLIYLPQGFSLLDDGYLLGLGKRVAEGERLYSDIYFFRTPLSVYWQAALISLFGGTYTVLASKIVWAMQITSTVVIASFVYQRWLSPTLLTITLCAALVYSSMLLSFAWYSYDGMFFTVIFAFFYYKRSYVSAGVAAGLALMCKQSFLALIPITFTVWLIVLLVSRGSIRRWGDALMWCAVGALSVVTVMLGALTLQGSLGAFWQNIFVLPASSNPLSISFLVVQNLPEAAEIAWPFTLLMATALLSRSAHWSTAAVTAAAFVVFWKNLVVEASVFVFNMTALLYVILLFAVIKEAISVYRSGSELTHKTMFYSVSIAALYLAGLNYDGWHFANLGGVLALPAVIVFIGSHSGASLAEEVKKLSGIPRLLFYLRQGKVLQSAVFSVAAFALAFTVHHDFPYNQLERKSLVAPFQSSMLSGLVSESHHVKIVDSVVNYVTENTTEVDSIFSFPDFTALNFLVSRPAWGNVQWYLKAEFNLSMAQEAVEHLRRSPPSLAVVRSHWKWQSPAEKPYSYARLRREWIIINALEESLTKVDSIGPFYIMRPRSDFGSVSSGHSDTLSGYALSGRPSSRISFESTGIRPDGQ